MIGKVHTQIFEMNGGDGNTIVANYYIRRPVVAIGKASGDTGICMGRWCYTWFGPSNV